MQKLRLQETLGISFNVWGEKCCRFAVTSKQSVQTILASLAKGYSPLIVNDVKFYKS